jgi:hypothetical protein
VGTKDDKNEKTGQIKRSLARVGSKSELSGFAVETLSECARIFFIEIH